MKKRFDKIELNGAVELTPSEMKSPKDDFVGNPPYKCPDSDKTIDCPSGTEMYSYFYYPGATSGTRIVVGVSCRNQLTDESVNVWCPGYGTGGSGTGGSGTGGSGTGGSGTEKPAMSRIEACVGKAYGDGCTWITDSGKIETGKCIYDKWGWEAGGLFCANGDYK